MKVNLLETRPMTRKRMLSPLVVAVVAWVGQGAVAQSRPDFSGRWTTDPDSTVTTPTATGRGGSTRGDMGRGWGPAITIAQDSTWLTVESALFTRYDLQPPLKFVYSLDGSETRLKQLSPLWLCLAGRRRPGQLVSVAAPARRKSRGVWPVHRRKKRWNAAGSE